MLQRQSALIRDAAGDPPSESLVCCWRGSWESIPKLQPLQPVVRGKSSLPLGGDTLARRLPNTDIELSPRDFATYPVWEREE